MTTQRPLGPRRVTVASRATTSFRAWLRRHRRAETAIGDLARDALADPGWPRGPGSLDRYRDYLIGCGACCGALAAFEAAWQLYRSGGTHDEP